MNLSSDVDLRSLAAICEHFTGADIKALLYNAQLNALDSDPVFAGISGGAVDNTGNAISYLILDLRSGPSAHAATQFRHITLKIV